MEYLEGETYSVEVLMQDGRPKYIIPQRKLGPKGRHGSLRSAFGRAGTPDIERAVPPILCAFDFRYLVNIDMSYQGQFATGSRPAVRPGMPDPQPWCRLPPPQAASY